jgi:hypothetical protein
MSDDGPGAREVAHRVFAAEFDDASLSYSESDEERAPNYVVTPTGARVNRLFVAGVLTEVERVNDETRRGRVVDPSGAFVTYAGQYQPEAQAFLERAEPPSFVALTGKARTFEPEDSDRVFTSVRPESLNEVDADTRDRWVVSAAKATLDRLAVFELALDSDLRGDDLRTALEAGGAPAALSAGIPRAIAHYDTSTAYVEALRQLAIDALELIAGDRDEVRAPEFAPDGGGEAAIGALPETDVTIEASSPVSDATDATGDEASAAEPNAGGTEAVDGDAASDDAIESEAVTDDAVESEAVGADSDDGADSGDASAETVQIDSESDSTADPVDEESEPDVDAAASVSTTAAESDDSASESTESAGTDTDSSDGGGLGDFDAGSDADDPSADAAADEMYQLDDEEREEIESEFGTDFSTGSEVDDPGEADIDVPEPAETTAEAAETAATEAADDDSETDEEEGDDDASADVDLEVAAVDAMATLDDGDGADREAVVNRVVDEHGVAADTVEDAIQDALMSGKCYEPGDGLLKPI